MSSNHQWVSGDSPLLISIPHAGMNIPASLHTRMTEQALTLPDTDHWVDRLYSFAAETGASVITANYSRYVIDLNRPADDSALYAGAGTGLLPTTTFDGEPVYLDGAEPSQNEQSLRIQTYWRPYHDALQAGLQRIRKRHGHAVLLDAHSIDSQVPMLFQGQLPDLNLGTNNGTSAARSLIDAAWSTFQHSDYSKVLDGRFRGGYITRRYGAPGEGTHALQLELSKATYMNEADGTWHEPAANKLQRVLRELVMTLQQWNAND